MVDILNLEFRVYDIKRDKYYPSNAVLITGEGKCYLDCSKVYAPELENRAGSYLAEIKDPIIEQFAFMREINEEGILGEKIFVGDFVECDKYPSHDKFIVLVKDIRVLSILLFGSELNSRKIIGNVHKNRELLGRVSE